MIGDSFIYDSEFPFYCRQCPICLKLTCKSCQINDRCVSCCQKEYDLLLHSHIMSTLLPILEIEGICTIVTMYICNVEILKKKRKRN